MHNKIFSFITVEDTILLKNIIFNPDFDFLLLEEVKHEKVRENR